MAPHRKKALPVRLHRRKKSRGRRPASLEDLVRVGVEQFVLKDATMMSFQKAIRAAAKKGEKSNHPLIGVAFRRIVKEAIRERKVRRERAFRRQSKSGRERSE